MVVEREERRALPQSFFLTVEEGRGEESRQRLDFVKYLVK
jgi:hypothetical protein